MASDRESSLISADEPAADALSVLARDHRLIAELLDELGRCAPQQLDPLARRICKMLRVHTQIEEELFYPAVRRLMTGPELIDACEADHASAKHTIARIESLSSERPGFPAALAALAEEVAGHVRREEQLFEELRRRKPDLLALGVALAERRDTLLEVLGLHVDDEQGAANQREIREPSPLPRRPTGKS